MATTVRPGSRVCFRSERPVTARNTVVNNAKIRDRVEFEPFTIIVGGNRLIRCDVCDARMALGVTIMANCTNCCINFAGLIHSAYRPPRT